MSYRVIREFADAQDNYYVYQVGDEFPRLNAQVSELRLKSLASNDNATHKPVITLVDESATASFEPEQKVDEEPLVEIPAQEKPKRTRRQK